MIHLTETLAVSLPNHEMSPNRKYIRISLDEYLQVFGGWSGLFEDLANKTEESERVTLVLSLEEVLIALCAFSKSLYPSASKADLKKLVVALVDQHLALCLYNRFNIVEGDLNLSLVDDLLDGEAHPYPEKMRDNLALEFLLADYATNGVITKGLSDRIRDLASENFIVLVTTPFFSVFESHLEPVLVEITDIEDPSLVIFKDASIPLIYDDSVDPMELSLTVLEKYTKEYLKELARKTMTGRTSRTFMERASEFMPSVVEQRYDQIKNSDWASFIESDLGLRYTIFEASTRIGSERFAQKVSKLTVFLLMTKSLNLSF